MGLPLRSLSAPHCSVRTRLDMQGFHQHESSNRSEEHTSELQSRLHIVCRLLLDKKNLRNIMTERSGLVLSADTLYLVESRLLPVARKSAYSVLSELVAKHNRPPSQSTVG